jgi:hypothetical protein
MAESHTFYCVVRPIVFSSDIRPPASDPLTGTACHRSGHLLHAPSAAAPALIEALRPSLTAHAAGAIDTHWARLQRCHELARRRGGGARAASTAGEPSASAPTLQRQDSEDEIAGAAAADQDSVSVGVGESSEADAKEEAELLALLAQGTECVRTLGLEFKDSLPNATAAE